MMGHKPPGWMDHGNFLDPISQWFTSVSSSIPRLHSLWCWRKSALCLTTMRFLKSLLYYSKKALDDEPFLKGLYRIEKLVSKVLSLAMIVVIIMAIWNLGTFLIYSFTYPSEEPFTRTLFKIFGLFLNVLIALEILENITAYLKKHVVQVELVIVTSLIAVARKIIILDLEKTTGVDIIGLGVAVLSLSISYWIIKNMNMNPPASH